MSLICMNIMMIKYPPKKDTKRTIGKADVMMSIYLSSEITVNINKALTVVG